MGAPAECVPLDRTAASLTSESIDFVFVDRRTPHRPGEGPLLMRIPGVVTIGSLNMSVQPQAHLNDQQGRGIGGCARAGFGLDRYRGDLSDDHATDLRTPGSF